MRLFAERGFAATKTKDLAQAAEVSEALIFKLFPGKEALYRALIERKIVEAEAVLPLAEIETSVDPLEDVLGDIARTVLRKIDEDATFLRLLLFAALEGHPLAAEFDAARGERLRGVIAGHLRRVGLASSRGAAEFDARAFVGLMWSFAMSRTVFRDAETRATSRDEIVRRLVTIFLHGVAPRPRRRA